jgi:hypothetical protein
MIKLRKGGLFIVTMHLFHPSPNVAKWSLIFLPPVAPRPFLTLAQERA